MTVVPIFGLVGSLLAVIAAIFFIRTRTFLSKAKQATGTVVQMVYSSSSDGGGGYSAVYQFKTLDGQQVMKQDSLSSNPPRFKVGQTVEVLYDPDNPNNARINNWMSLYFVPILLGGLGLIFSGVAAVLAVPQVLKLFGG